MIIHNARTLLLLCILGSPLYPTSVKAVNIIKEQALLLVGVGVSAAGMYNICSALKSRVFYYSLRKIMIYFPL